MFGLAFIFKKMAVVLMATATLSGCDSIDMSLLDYEEQYPMEYVEAYPLEIKTVDENNVDISTIINFDGVSEHSKNLYYEYVDMEPDSIKQALIDYGARINVAPSGKYTEGAAGIYYTGSGSINVNCSTDKRLKIAVNHEIGHCIDEILSYYYNIDWGIEPYTGATCKFVSNSDEFRRIYEEECPNAGYPSYNSFCPPEYFAETYRYIIEGNEKMMSRAPRATAFVKKVLNETFGTTY